MASKKKSLFEIKVLPDLPAILGTWHDGFKFAEHGEQFSIEASALLDAQTSPVYYILDFSRLENPTMDGLVLAANRGARGAKPNLHHAMNRGTLIIIEGSPFSRLAAKGMNSNIFGNVKIRLFESLDEALDYVRAAVEVEK